VVTHIDSATIALFTVAYDANGNTLTDAQGRSFSWDFENRLVQAVVPGTGGGTTTFKYDPFGRRIQKSGPLGTTGFLYDRATLVQEVDNSGNVLATYTQGKSIDEPLAQLRSGTTSYYQRDGLGSITSLSNSAGAVAETYTYDSYGKPTTSSGTLVNPFQYTGREFDSETGIYYYRARYFDPSAGRFLSEDRLRFGQGVNFYRYVQNNPLSSIDPSGNGTQKPICEVVTPNGMTDVPCSGDCVDFYWPRLCSTTRSAASSARFRLGQRYRHNEPDRQVPFGGNRRNKPDRDRGVKRVLHGPTVGSRQKSGGSAR
jgi:RHS repeat-associated protein